MLLVLLLLIWFGLFVSCLASNVEDMSIADCLANGSSVLVVDFVVVVIVVVVVEVEVGEEGIFSLFDFSFSSSSSSESYSYATRACYKR